jgi:hypothetical protein
MSSFGNNKWFNERKGVGPLETVERMMRGKFNREHGIYTFLSYA